MAEFTNTEQLTFEKVHDFETGGPYHLRCAYDPVEQVIQSVMIADDMKLYGVTIAGLRPMLGHNKTDECCGESLG